MWAALSLLSAFSHASKDALTKKITKTYNPIVSGGVLLLYSSLIVAPLTFYKGVPQLDIVFWTATIARLILDASSLILYVNAVKRTDLSLCLPMLALTPMFLLISEALLSKVTIHSMGMIGVLLIIIGTYLLNFKSDSKLLDPFKSIYKDKGVFMMLIVSIIYGITGTLHKIAILHSNAYFYAGFCNIVLTLFFALLSLSLNRKEFVRAVSFKNLKVNFSAGVANGISILSQMVAQALGPATYVVSIKRFSIIFSAILGAIFFKEKISKRVGPILLMITGVLFITIFK